MGKTKLITHENIPCWYELSWLAKEMSMLLRIHKDFARIAPVLSSDAPMPQLFIKEFRFSKFSGDLKKDFGFDNAFVFRGENEDFVEFLVPIPRVRKYTAEKCRHCNGTGRDRIVQEKCFACDGCGKEHFLDWRPAQAISASFNLFFSLAFSPDTETSATFPQLMIINLITEKDMNGGALGGYFSIPLSEWLRTLEEREIFPGIGEAMMTAGKKIFGKIDRFEKFTFRAFIVGNGCIVLQVPGNACDVSNEPEYFPDNKRKVGSRFGCHNVDTPMQQIELLVGLSALWDLVKKELKQT